MNDPAVILLVDDSPGFRALLLSTLSPAGYQVRQAPNGELGLAAVASNPPDLILLTLRMKGLDGLEVCRRLKAGETTRHIPVILISAAADVQERVTGLRLGATDFITTPFHPEELLARVRTHLSLSRANAALRRAETAATEPHAREWYTRLERFLEASQSISYALEVTERRVRPVWVSHNIERLLGYTVDEALRKDWWMAHLHPEDRDAALRAMKDLMARGVGRLEYRFRRGDGTELWVLDDMRVLPGERGAPTQVVGVWIDVTDRKLAEQALRESEERLRLALSATQQGFYDLNVQTEEVRVNAEYATMLGYDPATFQETATDWWERMHPEDREPVFRMFEDYQAGRRSDFRVELRMRTRDGRWRWIHSTGSLVSRTGDGRPLRMVGTLLDITERKEAEEALRASEARYRAVTESASLAIVTADQAGQIVSWNRGAEAMFGFTEAEMLGESLSQLMPHRFREPHLLELQRLQAGGPPVPGTIVELEGRRKDGSEFPLEISLAQWAVAEGWFITSMMMDITVRRRAEASLVLQSAALNAAANAIVITERDGTIVWVNPAFSALTGYSPEEAIGKNPRDLVKSGVHDQAFYKALWDTVLAGNVWQGEMTNRHKDGSLYPEEQTITPVKDPDGAITHFIAIKRDLTSEKALAAQFIQAQKMEAVGRLTGGIAHDFNNILMVILGYADFLVDGLRSQPRLVEDALEIRKAADRAATLTRQLLAFSRKQLLVPQTLNLNQVISDLEKLLCRLLGEDIQLRTNLAPDLGTVHADPGQIEQVIMNLAVNSRDAMPTGGPLEIRTTNADLDAAYARGRRYITPGAYVALWVTDRGTGISKDILPRLFEPYFTTKEVGKGTGLGLATVFGIVKQSGGHVEVYSELGIGTTFKVYLPRIDGPVAWAVETPPIEPGGGRETVLVVDDDTVVGGLVERILVARGYRVLLASGSAHASEIARTHAGTIDLLLTDVVMPERGGKELAAEIASLRPNISVLYMSGFTGDAISHRGLIETGVEILIKPVAASTLLRVVREVLDGTYHASA